MKTSQKTRLIRNVCMSLAAASVIAALFLNEKYILIGFGSIFVFGIVGRAAKCPHCNHPIFLKTDKIGGWSPAVQDIFQKCGNEI